MYSKIKIRYGIYEDTYVNFIFREFKFFSVTSFYLCETIFLFSKYYRVRNRGRRREG